MKIYICPDCGWIRMVSRRKEVECFKCGRPQMRLTNLEFGKYTNMSEKERQDYADAWLYIHRKKEKKQGSASYRAFQRKNRNCAPGAEYPGT